MPLRVGVDADNLLRDRRGIGRYVCTLLRAWTERFTGRISIVLLSRHPFPALLRRGFERRLGVTVAVDRRAAAVASRLDLVWYPWNGMTWRPRIPAVVTVHDLWPFVEPSDDPAVRRREQSHYLAAAQWAQRFIAVSQFTATQLSEFLGMPPDRIDVVPHGVGPLNADDEPASAADVSRQYVLFVGEAEPRKDLPTLMRAMALLPESVRAVTDLIVAGKPGTRLRDATPGADRVAWAGEVSDGRLASLYGNAAAFVAPSRYEGFGLPVLEAMRYGAPVIAARTAALPEAGGDAALYFPVGDAAALAEQLTRVLSDAALAARLSAAGKERAAMMTVEHCADRTLAVFERTVHG